MSGNEVLCPACQQPVVKWKINYHLDYLCKGLVKQPKQHQHSSSSATSASAASESQFNENDFDTDDEGEAEEDDKQQQKEQEEANHQNRVDQLLSMVGETCPHCEAQVMQDEMSDHLQTCSSLPHRNPTATSLQEDQLQQQQQEEDEQDSTSFADLKIVACPGGDHNLTLACHKPPSRTSCNSCRNPIEENEVHQFCDEHGADFCYVCSQIKCPKSKHPLRYTSVYSESLWSCSKCSRSFSSPAPRWECSDLSCEGGHAICQWCKDAKKSELLSNGIGINPSLVATCSQNHHLEFSVSKSNFTCHNCQKNFEGGENISGTCGRKSLHQSTGQEDYCVECAVKLGADSIKITVASSTSYSNFPSPARSSNSASSTSAPSPAATAAAGAGGGGSWQPQQHYLSPSTSAASYSGRPSSAPGQHCNNNNNNNNNNLPIAMNTGALLTINSGAYNSNLPTPSTAEYGRDVSRSIETRYTQRRKDLARRFCTDLVPDYNKPDPTWTSSSTAAAARPTASSSTRAEGEQQPKKDFFFGTKAFLGQFGDPFFDNIKLDATDPSRNSLDAVAQSLRRFSQLSLQHQAAWFPREVFGDVGLETLMTDFKHCADALDPPGSSKGLDDECSQVAVDPKHPNNNQQQDEKREITLRERADILAKDRTLNLKAGGLSFFLGGWKNSKADLDVENRPDHCHSFGLVFYAVSDEEIEVVICNPSPYGTSQHHVRANCGLKEKLLCSMSLGVVPKEAVGAPFFYALLRLKSIDDAHHTSEYLYNFILPTFFTHAKQNPRQNPELSTPRSVSKAETSYHKCITASLRVMLAYRGHSYRHLKAVLFSTRLMMMQMCIDDLLPLVEKRGDPSCGITVTDEKLLRISCHQVMRKAEKGRSQASASENWVFDAQVDLAGKLCEELISLLPEVLVDAPRVMQPEMSNTPPQLHFLGDENDVAHPLCDLLLLVRPGPSHAFSEGQTTQRLNATILPVSSFNSIAEFILYLRTLQAVFNSNVMSQSASTIKLMRFNAFTIYQHVFCNIIGLPQYDPTGFWSEVVTKKSCTEDRMQLCQEMVEVGDAFIQLCNMLPAGAHVFLGARYVLHGQFVAIVDALLRHEGSHICQAFENFNTFNPLTSSVDLLFKEIHSDELLNIYNAVHHQLRIREGKQTLCENFATGYPVNEMAHADVQFFQEAIYYLEATFLYDRCCNCYNEDYCASHSNLKNWQPIQQIMGFIIGKDKRRTGNSEPVYSFSHTWGETEHAAMLALFHSSLQARCSLGLNNAGFHITSIHFQPRNPVRTGKRIPKGCLAHVTGGCCGTEVDEYTYPDGGNVCVSMYNPHADATLQQFRQLVHACPNEREILLRPQAELADDLSPEVDVTMKQLFYCAPYVGVPLLFDELARRGSWKMSAALQPFIDCFLFQLREWGKTPQPEEAPLAIKSLVPTSHLHYTLEHNPSSVFIPLAKLLQFSLDEDLSIPNKPPFFHLVRLASIILNIMYRITALRSSQRSSSSSSSSSSSHSLQSTAAASSSPTPAATAAAGSSSSEAKTNQIQEEGEEEQELEEKNNEAETGGVIEGLLKVEELLFGTQEGEGSVLARFNTFLQERPPSADDDQNLRAIVVVHRCFVQQVALFRFKDDAQSILERGRSTIAAITALNSFCTDDKMLEMVVPDICYPHSSIRFDLEQAVASASQKDVEKFLNSTVNDVMGNRCNESWKVGTELHFGSFVSENWTVSLKNGFVASINMQSPAYLPDSVGKSPECLSVLGDATLRCQISDVGNNSRTYKIALGASSSSSSSNENDEGEESSSSEKMNRSHNVSVEVLEWSAVSLASNIWYALGVLPAAADSDEGRITVGATEYDIHAASRGMKALLDVLSERYPSLYNAFNTPWQKMYDADHEPRRRSALYTDHVHIQQ